MTRKTLVFAARRAHARWFNGVTIGLVGAFAVSWSLAARAQPADTTPAPAEDAATAPTSSDELDVADNAATEPEQPAPVVDHSIEVHRNPVEALSEHFLGSTARAVRFNWRKSPVMVAVMGSELIERNNFGAYRLGGVARRAFGDVIGEVGLSYVFAETTPSSDILALTPYRQDGRPPHVELDVNIGYPLAEGVVTPSFSFIPAAEMSLTALGGARYLLYPEVFFGRPPLDIARDILLPQISDDERDKIDPNALPGMRVDNARYQALAGLAVDAYFQPGVWISPRAMVGLPVLAPLTGTALGYWLELSLVVGYAF